MANALEEQASQATNKKHLIIGGKTFSKKFRTKPIQTFGMLIFQGLEGFVHTFHK